MLAALNSDLFFPAVLLCLLAECVAELKILRAAIKAAALPIPFPNGSPVKDGLSPIFESRLSAFLATLAMPTISTVQGKIITPSGIEDNAE